MLGLTATLKAAQQQYDVSPVVKAMVADWPPETPRLSELASLYAGAEPDAVFDATWTSEGLIGRIYVDASGNVQGQVVAADAGSTAWATWHLIATNGYATAGACCCYGFQDNSQTVWFFWVDTNGHTIHAAKNVAGTWSLLSDVGDAGAGNLVASLACDTNDPTIRLIYAISGGQLFETHWTGSAWTTPLGDGGTWALPTIGYGYRTTGAPSGDGNGFVVVCSGQPQQTLTVKQFNVTTGTPGWAAATVLLTYGTGTGYTCQYPRIQETRASCRRQAIAWVEVPPSPLVTTPLIDFTPTHTVLTGGTVVPWRYPTGCTHGVKVLRSDSTGHGGPYWWVVSSNQVCRTIADTASASLGQRVSFSADAIEEISIDVVRENAPARVTCTVINDSGRYADGGLPGPHLALRRWSQLVLSLGYHTSAGDETVWQLPCWVDQIVYRDDAATGTPLVGLHATDCWGLLNTLRFRWTVTITNDNAGDLLKKIVWHVAGDLTWTPHSNLTSLVLASFTFHAGETLASAAERLLDMAGCVLLFRTFATSADGSGWDSVQVITVPWATGGSVYTYQELFPGQGFLPSNVHPIQRSDVSPYVVPSASEVEVVGSATTSISRVWPAIWDVWREFPSRVVDKTLDTQAKTDAVAANEAAWLLPERIGGELLAHANVGLEIGDQVTVTIATAPIANQVLTVAGYTTSWQRAKGILEQTVRVEGTN